MSAEKAEIEKLQKELAEVREERDRLLEKTKSQDVNEARFYDKTNGQFTDTFEALKSYIPEKSFENIRQILYGIKCDEVPMSKETLEAARNKNVY